MRNLLSLVLLLCTIFVGTAINAQTTSYNIVTVADNLDLPFSSAVSSSGEVYIADTHNHRVQKIDTFGRVTTFAGIGSRGLSGDGGWAISAQLSHPSGVAVSTSGEVYIAETFNHIIRKIDTNGRISTFAGNTFGSSPLYSIQLRLPHGVAVSSSGEVYIADTDNHRILKINTNGITTIAGTGSSGFSGDGGWATSAQLQGPSGVAVSSSGEVFIADYYNNRIRKVDIYGRISTIAGTRTHGFSGDGGWATSAQLNGPDGVAVSSSGEVFIADARNNRIRKVDIFGSISTIAGNGNRGFSGDGGRATSAQLQGPSGVAVSTSGEIYITDRNNHRIRKLIPFCLEYYSVLIEGKCEYQCFGKTNRDTSVCSSRGKCTPYNKCSCILGYYGSTCDLYDCYGISNKNSSVCSSNGQCSSFNNCICKFGYYGSNCQMHNCYGVPKTESNVCSGRGTCSSFNNCSCAENYSGANCENAICYGLPKVDPKVCSSHGICSSPNKCSCFNGYYGENCEEFNCFDINFMNSSVCSGHGKCLDLNICQCKQSIHTGFWSGFKCNECQNSYFGSECSTRIVGPAKFLNNYSGIVFQLLGPISYQQERVNCSKLISRSQISIFGLNPICKWTDRSINEFTIQFGNNYSLYPNMKVKFNRLVFENVNGIEDLEELIFQNADEPVKPIVILSSGKTLVGSCESFYLDASRSYSGDLKPLKYDWKMISSPNDTTLDLGNSSSIELSSSLIPLEGEYKIQIQVQSSISGAKSEITVWNFTKSATPLPIISIIGFKEVTIFKSEIPIVIKKSLIIPTCFQSNSTLNIVWKQSGGPESSFEIDNFDNMAITQVTALNNENTYEYTVTATSIENPLSTTFETVRVTVKPTPMTLMLYTDEVSLKSGKIIADFNDPDQTRENEIWMWSCWDSTKNFICSQDITNMLMTKSNEKSPFIVITDEHVKSYSKIPTFIFSLYIYKRFQFAVSFIEFKLPESNEIPPAVTLISVTPSRDVIAKSQVVNLQLHVTANGQSNGIDKYITREWTLNNRPLEIGDALLSLMNSNPSLSNSIVLDAFYLQEDVRYQLSLKVTDNRNSQSALYTHTFRVAPPPKACPCSISPTIGTALETSFTFSCTNCQSSLKVTYGFIDDKTGALIELYSQGGSFSSKLPCSSSPLNNKIVTTFFKIIDTTTGAFTELKKDVTIEIPIAESLTEVWRKVSDWTSYQKSLNGGDSASMVFNSATLSRTSDAMIEMLSGGIRRTFYHQQSFCQNGGIWNEERNGCDCPSGFSKVDCGVKSEDFSIYKEIRKELMINFVESFESRNRHEKLTQSYLTSLAFGLDSLIERFDEVDDYGVDNCIQILKVLLNPSNYNNIFRIPAGVDKLLSNTINNIYRYLQYHKKELKIEAFELLKQLSKLSLKGMFVGERDKQINFNFAQLSTNKLFRYNFESRIISTSRESSISLPQEMPLYLSEKSNRKSISFISMSTSDVFGIGKKLSQPLLLERDSRNNNSKISTDSTSIKYMRSEILLLELVDVNTENIVNSINYTFNYFSLNNYTEDTLINSTQTYQTITNIYRTSQFSCAIMNLTSFEIIDGNWCELQLSELSNIATCKCNSTTGVFLIENVIEKRQVILQGQNLGIILGPIFAFIFLLIVALIVGILVFVVIRRGLTRKKDKTITKSTAIHQDTVEMKELPNNV